jgi:hypothetical protein
MIEWLYRWFAPSDLVRRRLTSMRAQREWYRDETAKNVEALRLEK